jgi:hypothetical protein
MKTKDLISIQQLCTNYDIPISFVDSLYKLELIEIVIKEDKQWVSTNQIKNIEKMIRLHYELDINLEGMHAISNLLNQVEILQKKIIRLNNKLKFYEGE